VDSVELEMGFLSTQQLEFAQEIPAPEPTPAPSQDTRKVKHRSKGDRKVRATGSVPPDSRAEATAVPPPASRDDKSRRPRGRGLGCCVYQHPLG